jgi:hypothetical protein
MHVLEASAIKVPEWREILCRLLIFRCPSVRSLIASLRSSAGMRRNSPTAKCSRYYGAHRFQANHLQLGFTVAFNRAGAET